MDDALIERLAMLFATMAEPMRLRILGAVAERPHTGQELAERFGISPPTVSHHMAKLTAAGLVAVTADAQRRIYSLDRSALQADVRRANEAPPRREPSRDETEKILAAFFDGERLRTIPAQRKKRVVVLRRLVERFEPGREYAERDVNDLLRRSHDDVATLRRELVDYGFLTRNAGVYRVAATLPRRGETVAQEVGEDEAAWFRALLAGAADAAIAR